MGDPDLSASRSLADVIRLGDPDAIAGFRDAHVGKVQAFCAAVCLAELVQEACEASFLEFLGRITAPQPSSNTAGADRSDALDDLTDLLLRSTRSAAAGRFDVVRPLPSAGESLAFHADMTICAAMPELIAAAANGELRGDAADLARQQRSCATCTETATLMLEAEQTFVLAPGPEIG